LKNIVCEPMIFNS